MDSSITKAAATKKAKALLAKMKTKGWKIRVHENLGWHYGLFNEKLSLHASKFGNEKITYHCMLGEHPGTGIGFLTAPSGERYFRDPNKAVKFCVEYARRVVDNYVAFVELAEEGLAIVSGQPT